jgi:adenylate cyclase
MKSMSLPVSAASAAARMPGAPASGDTSLARREVDQTLRLAQDEVEREIASLRLVIITVIAIVVTGITTLGRLQGSWVFFVLTWIFMGVSVVLLFAARRFGSAAWLQVLIILFDLLAPSTIFYLGLLDDLRRREFEPFAVTNFAASLFVVQIISLLRNSGTAGLLGAGGAAIAFTWVVVRTSGFHVLLITTVVLLLSCGYVSWSASRRARHNLERFARLQLLKRYLPSLAVDRVLGERMDEALSLGGQQLLVTLLATDLRGFTTMSESLQPAQVVEQLNAYHAAMLEEVRRHGGILDKFIGDGMLAVFGVHMVRGALASTPDAGAEAAVSCARDLLRALEALNATRAASGLPPLRMGVGLHTGSVIAGNIGVPGHRIEFTVIGDAVNTAARLEGLTKEAGTPVLVSGETVRRLREPSSLVSRPAVTLRGKSQPLEIFALD